MDLDYKWKWKRTWVNPAINLGSLTAGGLCLAFGIYSHISTRRKLNDIREDVEEVESEVVALTYKINEDAEQVSIVLQQAAQVIRQFKDEGKVFLENHAREMTAASVESHPSRGLTDNGVEMTLFPVNDEDDGWNYETEIAKRDPEHPYIIHRDEFNSNEVDYPQSTLTYYKSDHILCDEHDTPVYNIDKVVGKLEFGKGSRDPSIVYIRNEKLEAEYEVILDHGWYQVEVLGQAVEDHLKDSNVKHSLHKFREEE